MRRGLIAAVGAAGCLASAGCGGSSDASPFDAVGHTPAREELVEVELGSFIVPVPVVMEESTGRFEAANLMQIEFDLFAVVDPRHAKRLERIKQRHEGRIRDEVIQVCRHTPRDDLLEPEWATLKAHLLDAIQPLLGGLDVQRLGAHRINKDEL